MGRRLCSGRAIDGPSLACLPLAVARVAAAALRLHRLRAFLVLPRRFVVRGTEDTPLRLIQQGCKVGVLNSLHATSSDDCLRLGGDVGLQVLGCLLTDLLCKLRSERSDHGCLLITTLRRQDWRGPCGLAASCPRCERSLEPSHILFVEVVTLLQLLDQGLTVRVESSTGIRNLHTTRLGDEPGQLLKVGYDLLRCSTQCVQIAIQSLTVCTGLLLKAEDRIPNLGCLGGPSELRFRLSPRRGPLSRSPSRTTLSSGQHERKSGPLTRSQPAPTATPRTLRNCLGSASTCRRRSSGSTIRAASGTRRK